jgi:hypothetical protein
LANKKSEKQKQEINTDSGNDINNSYTSVNFAEDFAYRFMNQYSKIIQQMYMQNNGSYLNPIWANTSMKKFHSYTSKPTEEKITTWLQNPQVHEQELRQCSYFLHDAIQQYNRSIAYLSNLLNFDYELICTNAPNLNDKKETIDLYLRQRTKANEWLKVFRVKEQLSNIMIDVLRSGGMCYYLRENDDTNGIYLQPMPEDYTVVNGRTDALGYTYSLNMTFFYQFPEAMSGFAPEFKNYYNEFLDKKTILNQKANPWRLIPYDKSVVFKWDDTRVDMIPPLSGTMMDAIAIQNYKDILRLNMELQNYCLLFLKSPLDKDGKPTISSQEIINYTALMQGLVNPTTSVISAPMEAEMFNFKNASDKNNIVGQGESSYWSSVGVAGSIFGMQNSSAVALKYSIESDFEYCKHMYDQFERFLNWHLKYSVDGKFNFEIKFLRRCSFFLDDYRKTDMSYSQSTGDISRLMSSYSYEPYQHENKLKENHLLRLYDLIRPMQSPNTMSGKDNVGRDEKSDTELTESGVATRDGGYNEGK